MNIKEQPVSVTFLNLSDESEKTHISCRNDINNSDELVSRKGKQ